MKSPQVVKLAGGAMHIVARARKEPQISASVSPTRGALSASGKVKGGRHSQCAIYSGTSAIAVMVAIATDRTASIHPNPLDRGRIELPQVVEVAIFAVSVEPI